MPREATIRITADDREHRSGVVDALSKTPGVSVTQQRLPVGDYLINNQLIVERKTLLDFATSLKSGRLFSQLYRLSDNELRGILLLEGNSQDLEESNMRREAIQGALIHISLTMQIPMLRSLHPKESAQLMVYLARQLDELPPHRATVKRYQPHRIKSKRRKQQYLLQGLPGIGPSRARLLLEKFGSVEKVLLASESELRDVPGIGNTVAQKIRWIVEENSVGYGKGF